MKSQPTRLLPTMQFTPTPLSHFLDSAFPNDPFILARSREIDGLKISNAEHMMMPIREFFQELTTGSVGCVRGEPVHILGGNCFKAAPALTGWLEFAKRIAPNINYASIERITKHLEHGIPLVPEMVSLAFQVLDAVQVELIKQPRETIQSMLTHAQIKIEIDRLLNNQ